MNSTSPIEQLKDIMAKLRDPKNGCPWDIEQDFKSIIPHTIEEAYEVAEAVEKSDFESLKDELGDLLLQVIFHSQMANEKKIFNFDEVVKSIIDKLIFRHPHIFGNANIKTAKEQEESWEKIKAEERKIKAKKTGNTKPRILDGISTGLPALTRSIKLQKRAAKTGFDWDNAEQVIHKLEEEIRELEQAIKNNDHDNLKEEIGDILFCITNIARKLDIDPETSLRQTNRKFTNRFNFIEEQLEKTAKTFEKSSIEELEELWQKAKTEI